MTSSRFNSPAALHKTPGVCSSKRKDVTPSDPGPPPTDFPERLHFNVSWLGDVGDGTEDFSGMNKIMIRNPPSNFMIANVFRTPTRLVSAVWNWSPFSKTLGLQYVATNLVTRQVSRVRILLFLGVDFRPVIITDQILDGVVNAQDGRTDIWT